MGKISTSNGDAAEGIAVATSGAMGEWRIPNAPPIGASVYDRVRVPPERRSAGAVPGLLIRAGHLVWRAGRRETVVAFLLQLVGGVGLTVQLLLARHLVATAIETQRDDTDAGRFLVPLVIFAVVSFILAIAAAAQRESARLLSELVARTASDDLLEVTCSVDLLSFEQPDFHDQLDRAKYNATTRPVMAVNGFIGVMSGCIGAAGVTVALLALQPILVPVALLGVVPLWRVAARNSRDSYGVSRELTAADRERTYLFNALSNKELAKDVRAYAVSRWFRDRHDRLWVERIERLAALKRVRLRRSVVAVGAASLATLGLLCVVGWLFLADRLSVAGAGIAVWALIVLGEKLRAVIESVGTLHEAALFLDDVESFAALAPAPESPLAGSPGSDEVRPGLAPFKRLVGSGLRFTYPGSNRPAVDGVDIEIGASEVVALVGENGSGKTTLAKLLAGLYTVEQGSLLWDGRPLGVDDGALLRDAVAIVFQDFARFQLSAHNNIAIGRVERVDDRAGVVEAARRADAEGIIASLPLGFDTLLSRLWSGGQDLSGGQWQRVALARAFFRSAPFVIMDEPTAALDPVAEFNLFQGLRELLDGRSALLISHRFANVRTADRIYVLADGRIIEHGTHAELLANGGRYSELFHLQAAGYVESTD